MDGPSQYAWHDFRMPGREPGIFVKKLGTMPGTILGGPRQGARHNDKRARHGARHDFWVLGREPGIKVKEQGTMPGMVLEGLAYKLRAWHGARQNFWGAWHEGKKAWHDAWHVFWMPGWELGILLK